MPGPSGRRIKPALPKGLAVITAQRTGRADGGSGVLQAAQVAGRGSAATVRKPLSMVSGLFAFLLARGDMAANLAPRRLPAPLGAVPFWS
jgi:integrase/recombinase XerD